MAVNLGRDAPVEDVLLCLLFLEKPLFADGNGPGLEGASLLAGGGLWSETPKTMI